MIIPPGSEPASGSRQRERGRPLARRAARQEALLELLGAVELDRQRAELLDHQDQRGRRARAGDLLDRHVEHQRAGAGAAVLLREREPEQVLLGEQLAQVPRVLGLRVDLRGPRSHALGHDLADRVAEFDLVGGERVRAGGRGLHAISVATGARALVCARAAGGWSGHGNRDLTLPDRGRGDPLLRGQHGHLGPRDLHGRDHPHDRRRARPASSRSSSSRRHAARRAPWCATATCTDHRKLPQTAAVGNGRVFSRRPEGFRAAGSRDGPAPRDDNRPAARARQRARGDRARCSRRRARARAAWSRSTGPPASARPRCWSSPARRRRTRACSRCAPAAPSSSARSRSASSRQLFDDLLRAGTIDVDALFTGAARFAAPLLEVELDGRDGGGPRTTRSPPATRSTG